MNEFGSVHTSSDWGVVLLSIPSKHKKGIAKNLEEIFKLEKRNAEQILSNAPLILLDGLTLQLAACVRNFFQKLGAVAEATNHEVIKKNYWGVRWAQAPDLSFFMKEMGSAQMAPAEKKTVGPEMDPGVSKPHEAPVSAPQLPLAPEDPPSEASSQGVDPDWTQRVKELDEKLRKIHREKQEAQEEREEERIKNEEIAKKTCEDLQREAQKIETLTRESEEWRSRAAASGEKVRELETALRERILEIENLTRQKEELIQEKGALTRQSEKAAAEAQQAISALRDREQELLRKIEELERHVQQMTESLRIRDSVLAQFEKQITDLAGMSALSPTGPTENPS